MHTRSSPLLSVTQAAAYLHMSVSFLNKARLTGMGPEYRKLGRNVRYALEDLDRWVDSHRMCNTSQRHDNGEI